MSQSTPTPDSTIPWWKFGYLWLVLIGPAVVVVAGLATLYIAMAVPDQLVAEDYYVKGMEINKTLGRQSSADDHVPAMQARNHAATGGAQPKSPAGR